MVKITPSLLVVRARRGELPAFDMELRTRCDRLAGRLREGGVVVGEVKRGERFRDVKRVVCRRAWCGSEDAGRVACPVYGFYEEDDARVNATIPKARELMKTAGKKYDPVIYKGAGHGFMREGESPTGTPENKKARDDAWARWKQLLAQLTLRSDGDRAVNSRHSCPDHYSRPLFPLIRQRSGVKFPQRFRDAAESTETARACLSV